MHAECPYVCVSFDKVPLVRRVKAIDDNIQGKTDKIVDLNRLRLFFQLSYSRSRINPESMTSCHTFCRLYGPQEEELPNDSIDPRAYAR